jgi:membrane protein
MVDRVDAVQRRRRVLGFPLAVVYKFFDDQGGYLAAALTYYALVAILPLLLIASSVLGFVLQGNPTLRDQLLTSALSQFPVVGTQLGTPQGLQGSTSAVVIGALTALYGVLGLGQAAQNAVNVVWAVPRNSRLNPVLSRISSLLLLVLAALAVLAVTVLTSVASHLEVFGSDVNGAVHWLVTAGAIVLNAVVLSIMMRLATSHRESFRSSLPGGLSVAVLWQTLQSLGGTYVKHVVNKASDMNAVFAVVLGLLALLYIASVIAVLGLEINVVLSRRLYPRALLTPFTDAVDLTEADVRAYADYAKAQRHKGFERVRVTFRRPRRGGPGDQDAA